MSQIKKQTEDDYIADKIAENQDLDDFVNGVGGPEIKEAIRDAIVKVYADKYGWRPNDLETLPEFKRLFQDLDKDGGIVDQAVVAGSALDPTNIYARNAAIRTGVNEESVSDGRYQNRTPTVDTSDNAGTWLTTTIPGKLPDGSTVDTRVIGSADQMAEQAVGGYDFLPSWQNKTSDSERARYREDKDMAQFADNLEASGVSNPHGHLGVEFPSEREEREEKEKAKSKSDSDSDSESTSSKKASVAEFPPIMSINEIIKARRADPRGQSEMFRKSIANKETADYLKAKKEGKATKDQELAATNSQLDERSKIFDESRSNEGDAYYKGHRTADALRRGLAIQDLDFHRINPAGSKPQLEEMFGTALFAEGGSADEAQRRGLQLTGPANWGEMEQSEGDIPGVEDQVRQNVRSALRNRDKKIAEDKSDAAFNRGLRHGVNDALTSSKKASTSDEPAPLPSIADMIAIKKTGGTVNYFDQAGDKYPSKVKPYEYGEDESLNRTVKEESKIGAKTPEQLGDGKDKVVRLKGNNNVKGGRKDLLLSHGGDGREADAERPDSGVDYGTRDPVD